MIDASALKIPGQFCQQDGETIDFADFAFSPPALSDQARQPLVQRQNKAAGN